MENEINVEELVAAAKVDKTKFVALYDLYFDAIYRYLLTRLGEVGLAEDLTAETFLIALNKLDGYTWTGKPFIAWLYKIALNELRQHFRSKKSEMAYKEKMQQFDWSADAADHSLKTEELQEERAQDILQVSVAFTALKVRDQDVLTLRYFEELSYEDIANVLNTSTSNVGVMLKRALKRLSKHLTPIYND